MEFVVGLKIELLGATLYFSGVKNNEWNFVTLKVIFFEFMFEHKV